MEDHCLFCGAYVSEGRQVCSDCEKKIMGGRTPVVDGLTLEEIDLGAINGIYYRFNHGIAFDHPIIDLIRKQYLIEKPGYFCPINFSDYKIKWSFNKEDLL